MLSQNVAKEAIINTKLEVSDTAHKFYYNRVNRKWNETTSKTNI